MVSLFNASIDRSRALPSDQLFKEVEVRKIVHELDRVLAMFLKKDCSSTPLPPRGSCLPAHVERLSRIFAGPLRVLTTSPADHVGSGVPVVSVASLPLRSSPCRGGQMRHLMFFASAAHADHAIQGSSSPSRAPGAASPDQSAGFEGCTRVETRVPLCF